MRIIRQQQQEDNNNINSNNNNNSNNNTNRMYETFSDQNGDRGQPTGPGQGNNGSNSQNLISNSTNNKTSGLTGQDDANNMNANTAAQYTIPGVLHFIQHEWARFELERSQWDVDRAELQVAYFKFFN